MTIPLRASRPSIALGALLLLAGCGGASGGGDAVPVDAGGSIRIALTSEPATLFPPRVAKDDEQAVVELVYDRLAEIGPGYNALGDAGFAPRLATAWRWSADSLRITFTLDSTARFHDGTPVTAADVVASFAAHRDTSLESTSASLLTGVDSLAADAPKTVTAWFARRTPTQFFELVQHVWVMPAPLLDAVRDPSTRDGAPILRQPVGSGRFRVASWRAGDRVTLVADTANYRGRPALDTVELLVVPDASTLALWLRTGEVDFVPRLNRDQLAALTADGPVTAVARPVLQYQYITWNLRAAGDRTRAHPVFGDRDVRRALTMAVDQARLVRGAYDSLAIPALGPAPRALLTDTTVLRRIARDSAGAMALLDARGWRDADGDGVRERDGVPLRFRLLYPTVSKERERVAVLLQQALQPFGVAVEPVGTEIPVLEDAIGRHDFDAYTGGWNVGPGLLGLRQAWASNAGSSYGGNEVGYANRVVDAALDSAFATTDTARFARLMTRAAQEIVDDAGGLWTAEPRALAGVHRRLALPPLDATGWWHSLPAWRVTARR